ncbi:beta strand repeat-containing protein, partial [Methanobrevibacter sp.]|uniref:beta strand repeat-containing protein n=1 Tax=Methanobrevibacter sp. TaxID=66852 RepID=UPI0038910A2C
MKFKKEIITILLIICVLFTISAISAADSGDEAVSVANDTVKVTGVNVNSENNLQKSNDDVEILGDPDDGSFAALNTKISGASGTVLLENDYEYKSTDTITSGINIATANLIIDGQGITTIDAKGNTSIFNVNADGVTLRNIKFVNGFSSSGAAVISSSRHGSLLIENCTFIDNNGAYGSIYMLYPNYNRITGCTFINNTGSVSGAITSRYYQCNIDKCIFINNTGNTAGSIYYVVFADDASISNSIFINNTGQYDVVYDNQYASNYGNTLTAENNWWGLTKDNYKTATPKVNSALKINKQYVLDLNLDGNGNAFVSLNNLLEDGVLSEDTNYALPTIDLDVKGEDIEVPSKVKIDGTGKNTIIYTPADSYLLTVGTSGAEITRGVDPTFISLQNNINDDVSGELSLIRDYNYDADRDGSLTNGIEITKSLTIDGNGHFIDAKGLSNIFYFNDDTGSQDLILKNIIFRNAVGTDGAVVYFKGNKIEVINCTFTNNDASGQGDVLYINANSNENKITESSFINNVGSNSVIYMSPTTTANISNSIFISNDAAYNVVGSSNVVVDYNWWGNTAQNYDTKITKTDGITVNKWLFLKIEANPATEGTATVSLNNLFDGNDKGNYDSYALQAITLNLGGTHAQCNPTAVTLNDNGQATFGFAMMRTTATLTASFEDITAIKELEYVIVCDGSYNELYDLIWFTPQRGVLNLEHDFKFIDGVDTLNVIFLNKDITINGNGHTIDGDKKVSIFWFDENHVTLNNITFKNGVSDYGAAIYHSAQSLNVNYCTFINNQASDYGGAVYNYGGTNSFVNCTFINNYGNRGGAVYDNGPVNTFINSTFANNRASTGGAIYSYESDNTKFANCTFENNSATNAGVLCIYHSFVDSDNCTFKNNTADQGAVSYTTGYRNVITNSKFIKNIAKAGAVIYDANTNVASADKCIFINNTATTALIYVMGGYTLENSILLNNSGTNLLFSFIPEQFFANYNWFGNNITNYDERPNVPANLAMGPWYVLDANATNEYATISLNNLYDGTNLIRGYSSYSLPNITLNTESTNLDVPETITLNKNGKTNVAYALTDEKGLLTVKNANAVATTEIRAGDFNIIQKLVDENDVVELTRNFTYDLLFDTITEGIVIDRDNVVIKGNGYIIDAKGQSRIFKITGSNVVIENITFINAKSDENGGAIYFDGESGTVKSSVFTNNTAASGSAIYWIKNNGKVNDCVFIDNPGDNAIYAPSDLNADYNWFGNNASNYNKNIAKVEGFTLNNWYFLNITLGQAAATIDLNNVYNVLDATNSSNENCALGNLNMTFSGENLTVPESFVISKGIGDVPIDPVYKDISLTASFGSASYNKTSSLLGDFAILAELISLAGENGVVELDRNYNYIDGADTGDTGIIVSLKNLTINGNGFTINANGKSRIFNIQNAHNLTIKNITLTNGYSTSYGGAINLKAANDATIRDIIIKNSYSTGQGGAIYINGGVNKRFINVTFIKNAAVTGGALALWDTNSLDSNFIYNSTFVNNSASSNLGGGAIYSYSGKINITNSDFINNSAYSTTMGNNGGAIYISATADEVSIVNSTFRNNFAKGKSTSYGGAIYWAATDTLSISNSTFIGNDAKGGTSYGYGGVLYTTAGTHNIVNSTFLDNHAKSTGGGGVAYSAGSASQTNFRDSIFLGNYYSVSPQAYPSVVGRSSGSYNLDNCWFGNTPSDTGNRGVTPGTYIIVNNRLSLNSETDPYMVVGEDRNVKFVFTYVENGVNKVYDSSNLPKVNLTLTPSNGKVNKNNALMEENILFNADQRENVKITASYNVASLTVPLEVKYPVKIIADDEITIHVGDVDVPVPAELSESAATGVINYRGGDEFIEVMANGYVTGLKYGTSVLTIFYTGDDNYAPTSIEIPVNVIKYDTEVQTDSDSITVEWGADSQKLTARVISDNSDQEVLPITANINDPNIVKLSQDGYLTFLNAGKTNITLHFAGNDKYNPSEKKNITVTVNKVPSAIGIDPNEIELDYKSSNTTTLSLTGCSVDAENIAVFDNEGNPVSNCIAFENNVITISNLDVGTYTLKVTTTPDNNHTSVDATAAITVNKIDSSVTFSNNVVFDYKGFGTTTLTLEGCTVDKENISVVDHSEAVIEYDPDTNVITVSGLDAGEYTLKVVTTPDDNHKSVENTVSVTVNKIDSDITLSKSDIVFD